MTFTLANDDRVEHDEDGNQFYAEAHGRWSLSSGKGFCEASMEEQDATFPRLTFNPAHQCSEISICYKNGSALQTNLGIGVSTMAANLINFHLMESYISATWGGHQGTQHDNGPAPAVQTKWLIVPSNATTQVKAGAYGMILINMMPTDEDHTLVQIKHTYIGKDDDPITCYGLHTIDTDLSTISEVEVVPWDGAHFESITIQAVTM